MEICNDKILEMLVHTVTINRYVDEEQVSQLVACAEKYGFSRQMYHEKHMSNLSRKDYANFRLAYMISPFTKEFFPCCGRSSAN